MGTIPHRATNQHDHIAGNSPPRSRMEPLTDTLAFWADPLSTGSHLLLRPNPAHRAPQECLPPPPPSLLPAICRLRSPHLPHFTPPVPPISRLAVRLPLLLGLFPAFSRHF